MVCLFLLKGGETCKGEQPTLNDELQLRLNMATEVAVHGPLFFKLLFLLEGSGRFQKSGALIQTPNSRARTWKQPHSSYKDDLKHAALHRQQPF